MWCHDCELATGFAGVWVGLWYWCSTSLSLLRRLWLQMNQYSVDSRWRNFRKMTAAILGWLHFSIVEGSESDVTYSQVWWPILGIRALHLPIQSAHTHREHTPGAVGSHLCCGARGAVGGSVPCSRAPQSGYWGWRERCTFTPPTYNSCRPETRTCNLWITSPTL